MALLVPNTVASVDAGGTVPTVNTVSASDTFPATAGRTRYRIMNGNVASTNVTFTVRSTARAGLVPTNKVTAVAPGVARVWVIDEAWIDPSTGLVTVAHSVTATVTSEVTN